MKIAIASGKGGTGKTTVAVNMAQSLENTILLDCDVEEPNSHLFFEGNMAKVHDVNIKVPVFDMDKCTRCGKCADFCRYNSIAVVGDKHLFFKELCHGCGGCKLVCPVDAITEENHGIGKIEKLDSDKIILYHGLLNIGEPFGVPIIKDLKTFAQPDSINIFDSPPGTACPAVESISGSDYCILVTEPTPFGLHDLSLAVDVVKEMNMPFGVVINRDGIGNDGVEKYCEKEGIDILARIKNDRRIAHLYSQGKTIVDELPEYREIFQDIYRKIREAVI